MVINANQLMLYREIVAVCSEIHTKHINTLCGQNEEITNVNLVVSIVTSMKIIILRSAGDLFQRDSKLREQLCKNASYFATQRCKQSSSQGKNTKCYTQNNN